MTYVLIGLRRSGSVYQHYLLAHLFVFTLQALLPLRRCPVYTSAFFGSQTPLVFPSSLSLPSDGRDGGGGSRDALVLLPEGFPLLLLDFGPAGGVQEPLVAHSVHGSSLLSPRFIRGIGIQELLSCADSCYLFCPVWLSLLNAARLARCWGGGVFGGLRCSRLPLLPHLCTLGEVVRWVSLASTAPVRVLPGLPILGLGSREGVLSPLLVDWLSCAVLLLTLSLILPCSVSGRDTVGVDRLVCCFALCGRVAIVGGLRTTSGFMAFALVVLVWPVAVF